MPDEIIKRRHIIRFLKTGYAVGEKAPVSAIYECSECEEITAFRKGEKLIKCEKDHNHDDQYWYQTNQFIHFVSKNLNTEFAKLETWSFKLADFVAEKSGTMIFAYFHGLWFLFWTYVNTGHILFGIGEFDPYPFGLLTMIVSLEAIFLSTFILISQNRQAQKSELRAELDYQTNLKTEKDVAEILSILNNLSEDDKTIEKETNEILENKNIMRENRKKIVPKRKLNHKHVNQIMKDAGIEIIHTTPKMKLIQK